MKCFILSQLNFINCCLILVFIVNFSAGNSSKSSDDLIFVVPTETVDFVRLTNDSSTSETYSDALSLHFKLPLTLNKLSGKFLKEVELRIPSEFLSDDVSFLNNKKASYRSKCSTSDERSVFLVTLSRKTKCRSLVTHFQDVPVGLSKNCTNDDICIDVSRIMSHLEWCNGSLLEDIYLDLTSCVNNDDILQRIRTKRHLNLTLLYSEPSCNFDDGCEWRNISSEGYSYLTDKKQGTYGKFIPRHHNYMFNLLSPVIYGSGYQCHLTFSILSGFAEVSLTIHSGSVNKTIFVYLATNSSHWERLDLPIGRVSEHFQVEIQVILPKFSSLSIDNVTFEHCSESEEKDDFKQKCKNDEFKCSTGLCVSKDKICDLVPDCLFSDDEENAECESIPVEGRCDFETTTCNWTMETISTDSNCNWNRRSITQLNNNKMPERTISKQAEGYVLYIQTTNCKQVQPLKSRIFPAFEPGNCEIKFSYSFEQVGELFLKMCYNKSITSDCVNLRTFPSIDHWKKISVVIPEPEKEFYLEFDTLPFIGYILLDNIIMTPDCFREKLTDPLVNPVDESDIEVMMTSIGASVGVFLGVVIALTSLLVYKRYRKKYVKDDPYGQVSAHSSSTSCSLIEEKLSFKDNASLEHFDSLDGSNRPPSLTYSDIATTISPYYEWAGNDSESIRNVPRKRIKLARLIGKGAFGEVYYGLLADVAHIKGELPVAIKTLPSLCSEQTKSEFFFEALILSKFKHPNIVRFLGISVDEKSMFLILELMEGGDVRSFLREARPREPEKPSSLCVNDLLRLASDIALGCQYLELNKFIHRDIAARNCLLTEKGPKRIAKIADFGMARDVYRTNYYRKNGIAMIPVKWMPPEAFFDGVFTVKTDVWAFGVVLWEIFTMGFVPYPGRSNAEVMKFVTDGGRLECPSLCPEEISNLIPECWAADPGDRPSFSNIVERLRNFNQHNYLYTNICLSDLKGKGLAKDENTTSSSINYISEAKSRPSSKTVTADVHIVAV